MNSPVDGPEPGFRDDGALFAPRFDDLYFQADGLAESRQVFVDGNDLRPRFARARRFTIGETGFGTGLNFLAARTLFLRTAPPDARLCYVAVEGHPLPGETMRTALASFPELATGADELASGWEPTARGFVRRSFDGGRVLLCLLLGDVEQILPAHRFRADAWFLDGFAPSRNPAMWSDTVLAAVAERTRVGGTVATFTVAGTVRRGLARAGFATAARPGFGRKREMLTGVLEAPPPDPTPAWLRIPERPVPDRVTVVGAGLAGTGAARALATRGVEVTVVDRVGVATGASGHGLAVLQPRLGLEPDARFVARAFDWTRAWLDDHAEGAFLPCGALHPATDAATERRLRDRLDRGRHPEDDAVWLDRADCDARAGAPLGARGGVWIGRACAVRARVLCERLLDHPRIRFRRGDAAEVSGARVLAHALGARAAVDDLPMQAARGQLTALAAIDGEPPKTLVCHGGYLTPAIDGLRAVGATYDLGDEDSGWRAADDGRNLARFRSAFPSLEPVLAAARRTSWTGVRATTPDRLPYVGPVPDREAFVAAYGSAWRGARVSAVEEPTFVDDVFVSLGHGSRGVATGPFAGEILAAMICGEPIPLEDELLGRVLPVRAMVRRVQRAKR